MIGPICLKMETAIQILLVGAVIWVVSIKAFLLTEIIIRGIPMTISIYQLSFQYQATFTHIYISLYIFKGKSTSKSILSWERNSYIKESNVVNTVC